MAELERFCFLDDADLSQVGERPVDHNRLGFSLQGRTAGPDVGLHRNSRTAMRYVKPGGVAVAEITELLDIPHRRR